jgi:hypothetical protein
VSQPPSAADEPDDTTQPPPAVDPPSAPQPPAPYGAGSAAVGPYYGPGALGKVRGTGKSILFFIITLGIYGWFWYYGVFDEMKRHRNGEGLGGGLALILAIFVGIVMPFLTGDEVGKLYESRGQPKPVSAITGLWILLPLVGGIIWFVKTNGALNAYWESLGAVPG